MKKCLIVLLVLACLQITQAQTPELIYTEFGPDDWIELSVDQQYNIDINNDGISPDVAFYTFQDGGYIGSYVFARNGWTACCHCIEYAGHDNIFYDLSTPFNDSSLVWGSQCLAEYYTYGLVPPLFYKIGLRHCDGQDCYYGWMEFEEDRNNDPTVLFHISRICYCTIPNYPLQWGQTSLEWDVDENKDEARVTLHPNPTTGLVTVMGKDLKTAEVVNMLGQRMAMVQGEGETMQIDISNLPTGIYFVNITDSEDRKCVRKVVKE